MNIKRYIGVLLLILFGFGGASTLQARTAADDIAACASKIRSAGGVQANFSISGPQGNSSGVIKSSGKKFSIVGGGVATWYDGKNMWSLNKRVQETSLMCPTAAEIAEVNPLAYLSTVSGYTAVYQGSSSGAVRNILLTPKSRQAGIKSVVVTLNTCTMLPTQLKVSPVAGGTYTLRISNAKVGVKFPPSTFVYPAKSYPKAKVIDLR